MTQRGSILRSLLTDGCVERWQGRVEAIEDIIDC